MPLPAPAGGAAPHAVYWLREQRLARAVKPFRVRGGLAERCPGCRVRPSHCFCHLRYPVPTRAGICLLMADIEPLKPSNTGWLIADVAPGTQAFTWRRTGVDPRLLGLLSDPQWQPYLVFPAEYAAPERRVTTLAQPDAGSAPARPLFVLLDGTWAEACKMFRKSPYLDRLPVLSLQPEQASVYILRHAARAHHLCTAEVGAQCLALAGDRRAAEVLSAYLDVFTHHALGARAQQPPDLQDAAHQRLAGLRQRLDHLGAVSGTPVQ